MPSPLTRRPRSGSHLFRCVAGALAALLLTPAANAISVGGLESCPLPGQALGDCTFVFSGGRGAGVVPGQTTAGPPPLPQYFVLDPFFMPHLEANRPSSVNDLYLGVSSGFSSDPNWGAPRFVFEGFIDGMGNVNPEPERMGDMVVWHGFSWRWEADCNAAQGQTCGQLDVFSDITFFGVRIGDWIMVPEPTTLALLGLGLAGVGLRRRLVSRLYD